ncbi:MAG: ATP synthase subunit I [Thermodesulfobacteriota bacterium]
MTERRVYGFVVRSNWVLLAVAVLCAGFFAKGPFFWGVLAGGLLVTVNFTLLARTLKNALDPDKLSGYSGVLAKYYIRFTVSGLIIIALLASRAVDPVGLIIGLSVVVASIVFAVFYMLLPPSFRKAE